MTKRREGGTGTHMDSQSHTRARKCRRPSWTAGCAVVLATVAMLRAFAAEVAYVGSESSGDLTVPAHWSGGQLPGATGCAVFPADVKMPPDGLTLGADFYVKDMTFETTATPVALDLKGRSIGMPEIAERGLTAQIPSATNELFLGTKVASLTIRNGVVTNLSRISVSADASLALKDVCVYLQRPIWIFNFRSCLTVGPGAVIYGDYPAGDLTFPFRSGLDSAALCIDGGQIVAKTSSENWRRGGMLDGRNKIFEIKNGGRYEDVSPTGSFYLTTTGARVFVHDGGEFLMTNSLLGANSSLRGLTVAGNNEAVIVSNAVLRVSRFNFISKQLGSTNAFHDALADFRYYGTPTTATVTNDTGYFFAAAANAVAVLSGSANEFHATVMRFDGTTKDSLFWMKDGVLALETLRVAGTRNRVDVEKGQVEASRIYFDGAKDSSARFGAVNLNVAGLTEFWGQGNELRYDGTCANLGDTIFHGTEDLLCQDGGVVTGGVSFASSGNTVILTNRASRYMRYRPTGLRFAEGKTDNLFVIDDSTVEQFGSFAGRYKSTGRVRSDYGSVYTNCARSAIEFRGVRPKLLFSSANTSETGGWWVTATLGSFDLDCKLGTEPLVDPLAFRFVLPANGYVEAPLQNSTIDARAEGRPFAPGGNMRIEVDASRFVRTPANRRVPLVRDVSNFTCCGQFLLDIEALNRNNRPYLPDDASLRYVQERDADGNVVAGRIDLVFRMGLVLLVR